MNRTRGVLRCGFFFVSCGGMWRGREIVWCAVALLAGDYLGGWLEMPLRFCLTLTVSLAVFALLCRRWSAVLAAFLMLGFSGIQMELLSAPRAESALEVKCRRMQGRVSSYLEKILDPEENAEELSVVKALAIGDKSMLSRRTKSDFRRSGATHLLALSGLHVGIIYKLTGWLLAILGGSYLSRLLRGAVTISFLWVFAAISGLSPSITRAVLMITIFEVGSLAGRRSDGLNSLAVSAILITMFNPSAPWEISFQMSFLACFSIFTIYPRLNALLDTGLRLLKFIWNSATLAISCQMTTGVLAWFYFGTFPEYFIITNLLTVPLVGIIMYMVALGVATAGIPYINGPVSDALAALVTALNKIVAIISEL